MQRTTATCSPSSPKFSGVVVLRRNSPTCVCQEQGERMTKHHHRPHLSHLSLLVGFLVMLASAAAGQVKTARPGEQVERHLSSDQFKEWSLDPNVADDIKRIKVCRVQDVCKMRFKEGETPRMRVRNLVVPLSYEDENIPINEAFTRQVQQAVDNLRDRQGVTVRFIGYTDDAPLSEIGRASCRERV